MYDYHRLYADVRMNFGQDWRSGLRRGARPRQGDAPLRELRQGSGDTAPGLLSSVRGITRKLDIKNVIDIFIENPLLSAARH